MFNRGRRANLWMSNWECSPFRYTGLLAKHCTTLQKEVKADFHPLAAVSEAARQRRAMALQKLLPRGKVSRFA